MLRGKTTFRCTQCQNIFRDLDIEYCATVFSAPVKCPQCGSIRTLPLLASERMYEDIWKSMEERDKN